MKVFCTVLFFLFFSFSPFRILAQLPDGFALEEVTSDVPLPLGIAIADSSNWYAWSQSGQVRLVNNGSVVEPPVIDISEEVGFFHDHGLLSVTLDPTFEVNGYIYLFYVVDRHHLLHFGDTSYHPDSNEYFNATIARVTRFTIDTEDYTQLVPNSRTVLIGATRDTGIPVLAVSHVGGTLMFGADGTLLLTTGDGTWGTYAGEGPVPEGNYDGVALSDGIISPDENIGSWRAQYVNNLNGKVLRFNPQNGEGVPSNPYYEPDKPWSARSKIWAMGFRNPFRASIDPLTGSTDPAAGNPGTIYISDVGNWRYEELNICDGSGMNFGWPLYEGPSTWYQYDQLVTYNQDEPNPLADSGGCDPYFTFHELIQQPTESHNNVFLNPCDQQVILDDSVITSVHSRPNLTWNNYVIAPQEDNTFIPGFDSNGNAISVPVQDTDLDIVPFEGSASIGGDFYLGSNYPEEYFGAYFQSDYAGWVRVFWTNEAEEIIKMEHFTDLGNVVQTKFNPYDGCIYFTTIFPDRIYKLSYGGNRAPVADLTSNLEYGSSPLAVLFDASGSVDLDQDELTYAWDFGDGNTSIGDITPNHTFVSPDADPISYLTALTITDSEGNTNQAEVLISLNNSPPQVQITGEASSDSYDGLADHVLNLNSIVSDNESTSIDLDYKWSLYLHHNSHFHLEETITNPTGQIHLGALGCNSIESYHYRLTLEVEDPQGLIGIDEKVLYPDCGLIPDIPTSDDFYIYPNPNLGTFNIRGPFEESELFDISIYDSMGRVVLQKSQSVDDFGRIGINAPGLNTGLYYLKISNDSQGDVLPFLIGVQE